MSAGGRDSQSIAFFSTPGTELLYSGVAIRRPSAAAIWSLRVYTDSGMPSAASKSPLYRGIFSIDASSSTHPLGVSVLAARSRAPLYEPFRTLPEIPTIVVILTLLWLAVCRGAILFFCHAQSATLASILPHGGPTSLAAVGPGTAGLNIRRSELARSGSPL